MPAGPEPPVELLMLMMSDPRCEPRVIRDMLSAPPGSQWRWTNQSPRFKMPVDSEAWDYHVEFTVPDVILKRTGPVTVHFIVNDREVGQGRYSKDSHYEFNSPVDPALLAAADPVTFGLDVDPVFVSESDGMKLGVLLESIGFRKAQAR
jgi:hypothetical protein